MNKTLCQLFLTACFVGATLVACGPKPEAEGYSATNNPIDADNTARNAALPEEALVPGDQGTSEADREITQRIRKALVVDASGYSATAKNIKIITVDGKVTLRGPVNTAAEKDGILTMARNIAGAGAVVDELEIKAGGAVSN